MSVENGSSLKKRVCSWKQCLSIAFWHSVSWRESLESFSPQNSQLFESTRANVCISLITKLSSCKKLGGIWDNFGKELPDRFPSHCPWQLLTRGFELTWRFLKVFRLFQQEEEWRKGNGKKSSKVWKPCQLSILVVFKKGTLRVDFGLLSRDLNQKFFKKVKQKSSVFLVKNIFLIYGLGQPIWGQIIVTRRSGTPVVFVWHLEDC